MDANGRSVAQEVVEHEQGLDSRFATGGFYGQAIYLAERATYPIGGRYVRSAGLALRPIMHGAVVCRYAHRVAGTHGRRVQLLVVRAALGTQQVLSVRPSQCVLSRWGGASDGRCSSWFWTGARRDDQCRDEGDEDARQARASADARAVQLRACGPAPAFLRRRRQ